jgi:hypothetical protein
MALLKSDPQSPLLSALLGPATVTEFYAVVSFLNLVSEQRQTLLPIVSSSPGLLTVTRLYLVSVLISIMRECLASDFSRSVLSAARDLAGQVAAFVRSDGDSLRHAPENSDEAIAMLMIFHGHSATVQRLLLGPDFFGWMSKLSLRQLTMIEHSAGLRAASDVFLLSLKTGKIEKLEQFLAELSPAMLSFLKSICNCIGAHAKECGIRLTGETLLPLFETVIGSENPDIAGLMPPLASILASNDIIQNWDDTMYLRGLLNVLTKLCRGITDSATGLFRVRIRALNVFAQTGRSCWAMSQVAGFNLAFVKHLSEPEPSVFEQNWMFFERFTKYAKVLDEFFKKNGSEPAQAGLELAALVDGDNPKVLKKWVRFLIRFLKPDATVESSPAAVVAWCEVLVEKLSRVSILITKRATRFKDDEIMIVLLEELLSALLNITIPGTQGFLGKIQEHLLSMDANKEVKGRGHPAQLRGKKMSAYLQKSIVDGTPT